MAEPTSDPPMTRPPAADAPTSDAPTSDALPADPAAALADLAGELARHLEWMAEAGVRTVRLAKPETPVLSMGSAAPPAGPAAAGAAPRSATTAPAAPLLRAEAPAAQRWTPPTPAEAARARTETVLPGLAPVRAPAPPAPPVRPKADAEAELAALRAELGEDCTRCKLCQHRQKVVFGQGFARSEIVFVGEGPGEEEDNTGKAFVGRAGQLLTKMIEAMGYERESQTYICNIVKCRPPGNRKPEPDEVEACRPFVERQLRAIDPKVIVVLGATAAQALLRTDAPIGKLRNRWTAWNGVPVMPTFHPSYLLRAPQEKGKAWDDLKLVMERLGKTVPGRK